MAEAVVEERGTIQNLFYCHKCNVEISIPNTEYVCPICDGGFVEELPAPLTGAIDASASSSTSSVSTSSGSMFDLLNVGGLGGGVGGGGGNGGGNGGNNFSNRANTLDAIRHEITTLLMSRNPPNVEISFDPSNNRRNIVTLGGGGGGGGGGVSVSGGSNNVGSGGGITAGGRVRGQNLDRLDNVLIDFLQSIAGDVDVPFGNSQMFFMGNPGDYAWGREGIDTIVTQLLNQMETSGPPPLPKDKIKEIPTVNVTKDDVDKKLQCSVCWEDFRLDESVRKLPCTHIYHENCIVPWLDLHGTCPICRKSLGEEDEDANMTDTDVSFESIDGLIHGNIDTVMINDATAIAAAAAAASGGGSSGGVSGANVSGRQPAPNATSTAARNNSRIINNSASVAAHTAHATPNTILIAGSSGAVAADAATTTTTTPSQTEQQRRNANNIFGFEDGNVDLD